MLNGMATIKEAKKGFYPTPSKVADELLAGLSWGTIREVLEPSAGAGNLVRSVLEKAYINGRGGYNAVGVHVDCVEIDPHLRAVLNYEFQGQKKDEIKDWIREYRSKTEWGHEGSDFEEAERQLNILKAGTVRIVHDDFLTLSAYKRYDLIVMNPPFANGDEHLLKAIEMQERYGGEIRCILNAETIRNPYTNRRKLLLQKLTELSAKITFHEDTFLHAERATDVEIAIIKVSIAAEKHESKIFTRLRKAAEVEDSAAKVEDLDVTDFLKSIIARYDIECRAGLELIREYEAMKPYIMQDIKDDGHGYPTLSLCAGEASRLDARYPVNVNKYLSLVRLKYWRALFSNKEFVGKLTTNLREKYMNKVEDLKEYDFTMYNIQQIATEMNAEIGQGIEDTIVALFDKFTVEHSYYPEMTKNVHYFNGWKTNKAHAVNSKVIIPTYGIFATYSWCSDAFNLREAEDRISDVEKVFAYLDGNMTANVDLHGALSNACAAGITKNIHCKFFDVTLYKKGTMHIKFTNQDLLDRFNIYCSRSKGWLPPSYGSKSYDKMSSEEKAVVDSFHGDGSDESGKAKYGEILSRRQYYLSEPMQERPLIGN